jgi:ribosomal protein S18 acetylase RimI-like enzyme
MKSIKSNIENLTSLWQSVSTPLNSYYNEKDFDYSLIENSEWPNRLWFNEDINSNTISLAKEEILEFPAKITVPYWDIYGTNSYQLLEEKGFKIKFEQIGMALKTPHLFTGLGGLSLKKVTTKEDTELWSLLFSKAFGYFINPILLNGLQENTQYYIAYHQNEVVGTGILHATNNVTGIHSVGVIPDKRRKGYAEQIMKLLINQAIQNNSNLITLQSSNMGKGLYLKLGFEEQFTIKNYIS